MQLVFDGSTVVGWKDNETWLPGGWIVWYVSDVEIGLERPETLPRYTGAV